MPKLIRSLLVWVPVAALTWMHGGVADAQTMRTMTSARQVWDREPIEVEIHYGAGTLRIDPADPPYLYQMELRYDERVFTPVVDYDEDDRRLRLGVRSPEGSRRVNVREGSTATIALTREVPLGLDLEFGAGKAEIDLSGVALRSLALSTGASETSVTFGAINPIEAEAVTIEAGAADLKVSGLGNTRARRIEFKGGVGATVLDFSGDWGHSATARVEMGVGALTLRLPRSQGIQVRRSSFLTSFSAAGLERRDDGYYSANWNTAPHKLTIDISAALGAIDIQWVD